MNTSGTTKLTILVETTMHQTLLRKVGRGNIGRFLIEAAKPFLIADTSLRAGYAQMATDEARKKEAEEWAENLVSDVYES